MFIDINEIRDEGLAFDEPLRIPDLRGIADETIVVESARVKGRAVPGGRGAELDARLTARVVMPCSRCLEPFANDLSVSFFLTLVAGEEVRGPEADAREAEDATLFPAPGGRADLVEICSEQIYLNLPLKPICDEGCRGLCPACGANRNRSACGCAAEEIDPRLAPLLRFKKRR
jgi:uncharacterized protein